MDLGACYSLLAKQTEITQPQRLATKNRAHGTATEGKNNKEIHGCADGCRAFFGGAVAGDSGGACCAFSGGGGGGGACGIEEGSAEGESGTKVAAVDADAGAVEAASAGTDAGSGGGSDAGKCEAEEAAGEDMGAAAREDAAAGDAADARQRQQMVPCEV